MKVEDPQTGIIEEKRLDKYDNDRLDNSQTDYYSPNLQVADISVSVPRRSI